MQNRITYTVLTVLLAIVGWIWTMTYSRLTSMEKELVKIQLELVRIQSTIVDRDEVVKIVREQLRK